VFCSQIIPEKIALGSASRERLPVAEGFRGGRIQGEEELMKKLLLMT
jgi:hypothetical protein